MKKTGITGSIGSGKSTVVRIFSHLGVPTYDADSRAKILMITSPALIDGIKQLFGNEAYDADHRLNRAHIAAKAFQDKTLLTALNALVHPAVFKDFDDFCGQHQQSPYIIKEAALMFESDSYKQLDDVIIVMAPEELRIRRAMERDGITRENVLSRMKNQFSQDEKAARADYQINNDEKELLIPQILRLHTLFSS